MSDIVRGFDGGDLELIAIMNKRVEGWFWAEYDDGRAVDAEHARSP